MFFERKKNNDFLSINIENLIDWNEPNGEVYYTHNSGHIEKWVTRFLDTLTNQIPVNGQISK